MQHAQYTVTFRGEIAPGAEIAEVKRQLGSILKLEPPRVEALFSGRDMVRRNLSQAQAEQYVAAFRRAGAVLRVARTPDPETGRTAAAAPVSDAPASTGGAPRAAAPGARLVCPACGTEQEQAAECGSCGVIVAKYRARERERTPVEPRSQPTLMTCPRCRAEQPGADQCSSCGAVTYAVNPERAVTRERKAPTFDEMVQIQAEAGAKLDVSWLGVGLGACVFLFGGIPFVLAWVSGWIIWPCIPVMGIGGTIIVRSVTC